MSEQNKIKNIFNKLKVIGQAISRVKGNNTHSGNLAVRDPEDEDIFYTTATGAQCGALVPEDIVPIHFSSVSWGDARGSTESTIHRKILSLAGINASMHAHFQNTTFISFDTKEKQLFLCFLGQDEKGRDKFAFHPIDAFGAFAIGEVRVDDFFQPVGSTEMEERIPKYLAENFITIVKGHGPFVRGCSPEELLYRASVLESSATLAINLRRRGIDIVQIQKSITSQGIENFFPVKVHQLDFNSAGEKQVQDPTVLFDFKQRLNYNYDNEISAYGTGSMSQKISAEQMIYCPSSAVPEGLDFQLYRKKIEFEDGDSTDLKIHKLIYRMTQQNTCMITINPVITAEAMALLAEQFGIDVLLGKKTDIKYTDKSHPVIVPIDAEAKYLNPRLGLVDIHQLTNMTADNPILNMLRWYKGCCVVSGYGVISTGKTTLEQAAHNASSAERIGRFRIEAYINEKLLGGPDVKLFEPKRKKNE
ncbi:Methylthioribulose-1-phosphate dehydratase [subsurface metagenome]